MNRTIVSRLARVELRIVGSPKDRLARLSDAELDDCITYLLRRIAEDEGQTVEPHQDDERARRLCESMFNPAELMADYGHLSDDELHARIKHLMKDCGLHLPEACGETTRGAR